MNAKVNYIPVKDIHVAIAQDDGVHKAYLINRGTSHLHNILITSKGYGEINGEAKQTSVLRHHFDELNADSFLVIESMMEDIFDLSNEFWVSYYIGRQIYDKKFVFTPASFIQENMIDLPLVNKKGILHN